MKNVGLDIKRETIFRVALCLFVAMTASNPALAPRWIWTQQPASQSGDAIAEDSQTTGVTDKEILIGSCSALSGPTEYLGKQQIIGAKTYINSINAEGGVNGRKITLLTLDDCYEPEKAINCFNQLVKSNVFAVAFLVGTPTAAKHVPMAEARKIPILGLYSGAQFLYEPVKPNTFGVRASYQDETRAMVDGLWSAGKRKIAVIQQSDAFGAAVNVGVSMALKQYKAEPIALGSFNRNTTNVNSAIEQVMPSKPDAVIIAGAYAPVSAILKKAHSMNWHPLFATVSFVGAEALIKQAGKDAEGVVITQVVPPTSKLDLPGVAQYNKLLKKYFPNEEPNSVSFEGFVDAKLLIEALNEAGRDLTRAKFVAALESMHDLDLGLGKLRVNYAPQRHKAFDAVYTTQVRDGRTTVFTDWKLLKTQ